MNTAGHDGRGANTQAQGQPKRRWRPRAVEQSGRCEADGGHEREAGEKPIGAEPSKSTIARRAPPVTCEGESDVAEGPGTLRRTERADR